MTFSYNTPACSRSRRGNGRDGWVTWPASVSAFALPLRLMFFFLCHQGELVRLHHKEITDDCFYWLAFATVIIAAVWSAHEQTHTHTHTHLHLHLYTHTDTHIHTHRHTHRHTHLHTQTHTLTLTHTHTHTHGWMDGTVASLLDLRTSLGIHKELWIWIHTHINIYTHHSNIHTNTLVRTHTNTHTHIHAYIHRCIQA